LIFHFLDSTPHTDLPREDTA